METPKELFGFINQLIGSILPGSHGVAATGSENRPLKDKFHSFDISTIKCAKEKEESLEIQTKVSSGLYWSPYYLGSCTEFDLLHENGGKEKSKIFKTNCAKCRYIGTTFFRLFF